MNPNKIKALLKRELTDIFRDKKTLCMMVLLPLLLYPLMIVGMTLLFSAITQSQEETTYQVAFADLGQEREQTLTDLLEKMLIPFLIRSVWSRLMKMIKQ